MPRDRQRIPFQHFTLGSEPKVRQSSIGPATTWGRWMSYPSQWLLSWQLPYNTVARLTRSHAAQLFRWGQRKGIGTTLTSVPDHRSSDLGHQAQSTLAASS